MTTPIGVSFQLSEFEKLARHRNDILKYLKKAEDVCISNDYLFHIRILLYFFYIYIFFLISILFILGYHQDLLPDQ